MSAKPSLGRFAAAPATQASAPAIASPVAAPVVPASPPRPTTGQRGRPRSAPTTVKPLIVRLGEADHKALKRRALDEGISMQELMLRGADAYLRANGMSGLKRR